MRQLVPHYILEKYVSGQHRGSLRAAGIFVDLSGFSIMTDVLARHGQAGAETLADVMRAVFEPLVAAVYAQGGFVVGYAGDAFTAIFDEQPARGPATLRGLAAVIAMQEHIHANSNVETPFGRFPIFIKAGLGFGEADWLILKNADGGRVTYCMRGTSVDGSVNAEECARPGDIVLDAASYAELQDLVTVQPAGNCFRLEAMKGDLPAPFPYYADPEPASELLSLFYPDEVVNQPAVGEFRQVVNMFIGIPFDPTDGAFVRPFMESIFALQDRYGGFFLRPDLDDKGFNILMFWGAPTARENDIDRALNFLLDLAERVKIPFKAGVTYKLAYAGFIGAPLREDYTAYGWGVNLASRLMESALPGEVRLDAEVASRADRHFIVTDLGEYVFKGFSGKSRVFALAGRKKLPEIVYRGDLVGRAAELERLAEFVAPLREGKFAGVLVVNGDAGIGKSRLIHTFQASSSNHVAAQWVVCQTDEILRQSLNPFKDWLRARFQYSESDPDAINLQNFESQLRKIIASAPDPRLAMELDRTASVLAALLGLSRAGSLYEQLDAKARYDNTLIALSALLQAESLRTPLILFLEDAQWMDEDTRTFLSYFFRALLADPEKQYPVAVIASKRPEGIFPKLDAAYLHWIDLPQLAPSDLGRIAETFLGGPAEPVLLEILEQRSEGNPFFAEQILRYLSENGLLARDEGGRYRLAMPAGDSLPTDVRALLVARLDRLSRDVREVVQTASVLGREFELRLLAEMLREDAELMHKVSRAEDADIWFPLDEVNYIFRHALLRDAAYSMQLLARQRQLHDLAVSAIESLYGHELVEHYGKLAYHAEKSGHGRKARTYLTLAGKSASRAYQNHQAVDYFTRALALTPAGDLRPQFDLLIDRCELYRRLGARDLQSHDLDLLSELAGQLNDEILVAHVLMLRSKYYFSGGEFPESIECAAQAVSVALLREDADDMLDAYNVWAVALLRQGSPDEAMQKAKEGLRQARIAGRRHHEGSILNSMGMIAMEQKEPASAQGYFEQALAIAQEIHDRRLETMVINNLGNSAGFVRADYLAARSYYEQAHAIVQEWGDRSAEGLVLANLGWVAGMQGDFEAARAYHGRALSIAREVGNPHQETYTLINLSAAAGVQGDTATAVQSARQACDLARRSGDRAAEAWSLLYSGHAFLLLGEIEEARGAYAACLHIREALDQPGANMEPKAGLIEAALASDDLDSARMLTEEILGHLAGGGTLDGTEEPLRIYFTCYRALERLKDPRSRNVLQEAGQLLQMQVSKFADEAARRLYVESVPWRRAIHRAWQSLR